MPPEIELNHYTPKSLSWTVGVIAYFLICGKFPYDGPSDVRIAKSTPLFQEDMWIYITDELKMVIKKTLEREPGNRLSLEEALAGFSKAKILKTKAEIQSSM
jgi:serine/threonine protein kinase